uniref:CYCLIN domain-containing protein n=1 Tax=Steinernema glaseri TaxID=37863 RepID=A0A1I7ZD20_9BILA
MSAQGVQSPSLITPFSHSESADRRSPHFERQPKVEPVRLQSFQGTTAAETNNLLALFAQAEELIRNYQRTHVTLQLRDISSVLFSLSTWRRRDNPGPWEDRSRDVVARVTTCLFSKDRQSIFENRGAWKLLDRGVFPASSLFSVWCAHGVLVPARGRALSAIVGAQMTEIIWPSVASSSLRPLDVSAPHSPLSAPCDARSGTSRESRETAGHFRSATAFNDFRRFRLATSTSHARSLFGSISTMCDLPQASTAASLSSLLLRTLLEREKSLGNLELPKGHGLVTTSERDKQARWICLAARRIGASISTLGLAISIFDRTLSSARVQVKYVNCVAVTSLYLSLKLTAEEDDDEVGVDSERLLRKLQLEYSTTELVRMERTILQRLNFDLSLSTVDRFLHAMLDVIGWPNILISDVLRQGFETVLSDWEVSSRYRPATLALGMLSLLMDQRTSQSIKITEALQQIFTIEKHELAMCRKEVRSLLTSAFISPNNNWTTKLWPVAKKISRHGEASVDCRNCSGLVDV